MANDSYTEKTRTGCLGNLFGSVFGSILGLIIFIAAFPVEFWNEGRAIEMDSTFKQGAKQVLTLSGESADPANDGKIVYLSCAAKADQPLVQSDLGMKLDALRLVRTPEMYQWTESRNSRTHKKLGGGSETETNYEYMKNWSKTLNRSSLFKRSSGHENPDAFRFSPLDQVADSVHMGVFKIDDQLVKQMGPLRSYEIPVDLDLSLLSQTTGAKVKIANNQLFVGRNPQSPSIGDERVSFSFVPSDTVFSLVGRQSGANIVSFIGKNGAMFSMVEPGVVPAGQIFKDAEQANSGFTWLIRGAGVLMMFIGLMLMSGPMIAILNVIPLLGDIAEWGVFLVSFFLASVVSAITIGIAWLAVRPMLAWSCFGGAAVMMILLLSRRKNKIITQR